MTTTARDPSRDPVPRTSRGLDLDPALVAGDRRLRGDSVPHHPAARAGGRRRRSGRRYEGKPAWVHAVLYAHIVAGGLALRARPVPVLGRAASPHAGRASAAREGVPGAVLVAGSAALALAPVNSAGMVGFFGFGTLAVLWLGTAWRGYRCDPAWRRPRPPGLDDPHDGPDLRGGHPAALDRCAHGRPVALPHDGRPGDAAFDNAYAAVPFLCWLPNIVLAEWLIRRRDLPALRLVTLA